MSEDQYSFLPGLPPEVAKLINAQHDRVHAQFVKLNTMTPEEVGALLPDTSDWPECYDGVRDLIEFENDDLAFYVFPIGKESFAYEIINPSSSNQPEVRFLLRGVDRKTIEDGSETADTVSERLLRQIKRYFTHAHGETQAEIEAEEAAVASGQPLKYAIRIGTGSRDNIEITPATPVERPLLDKLPHWHLESTWRVYGTKFDHTKTFWVPEREDWPGDDETNDFLNLADSEDEEAACDVAVHVGYDSYVYLSGRPGPDGSCDNDALCLGILDAVLFQVDTAVDLSEDMASYLLHEAGEAIKKNGIAYTAPDDESQEEE